MKLAIALLLLLPGLIEAQATQSPSHDISVAAGRASMMYMRGVPGGPVIRGVNPRVIKGDVDSPELSAGEVRDSVSTARLAEALGMVIRDPDSICTPEGCDLRGMSGYLSLSEPVISGDSAVISVTILTPNPRPKAVYYESYRFGFKHNTCQWVLRWAESLAAVTQRTVSVAPRPLPGDMRKRCS